MAVVTVPTTRRSVSTGVQAIRRSQPAQAIVTAPRSKANARPQSGTRLSVGSQIRRGGSRSTPSWVEAPGSDPAGVLARIRRAQDGHLRLPSYAKALAQITAGQKTGHWIWYVWPCLAPLRPGTCQPSYLLPDLAAAQAYLCDDVLFARLCEITSVALEHLQQGIAPKVLFGSVTDSTKFFETMTFFAVAAAESEDMEKLKYFTSVLIDCRRKLESRTMEVIVSNFCLSKYKGVETSRQLLNMMQISPSEMTAQEN